MYHNNCIGVSELEIRNKDLKLVGRLLEEGKY